MSCMPFYRNEPKQTYENSIEILSAIVPKVFNWDKHIYMYIICTIVYIYVWAHHYEIYVSTLHIHSTSSTFTRQLNKWNHGLKSQITYKTRKFSKHTFLEPSSLSLFCLRKLISNILHNWMYREWLCARGRERGALAGRGIRAGTRVRGSQLARQSMQKLWLVSIGGMNMPYECECSVSGLWVLHGYS